MKTDKPGPVLQNFPETLLILGTDLAGKDHFANVLTDAAVASGLKVERRRGRLSASPNHRRSSEKKAFLNLWLEWIFLVTLPLHCRLLPYAISLFIANDIRRFRRPGDGSVIVVSHTALRLLAFGFAHLFERSEDIKMPAMVERTLRALVPATGARAVVLDIDHQVREERMQDRLRRGTADHFDRYMAKDPHRSERIESFLVWLGTTYLGAVCIENNNLSDAELLACLPPWREYTSV
jgi:hypothetical protein